MWGASKKKSRTESGSYWVCSLLESQTRLRVGRGVSTSEGDAAARLWRRWRWRLGRQTPPPLVSDGWGGHQDALLSVFGLTRGSHDRRRAGTDWQYVQVKKVRDMYRRVKRLRRRLIWGHPDRTPSWLQVTTAYVERTHLTSRLMNARLARRTLGFSKSLSMLLASVIWCDLVYNLVRPLKTLRQACFLPGRRWTPRSPAMAAHLTDHLWSISELLLSIPLITNS